MPTPTPADLVRAAIARLESDPPPGLAGARWRARGSSRNAYSTTAILEAGPAPGAPRLFLKVLPADDRDPPERRARAAAKVAGEADLLRALARAGIAAPRLVAHYPEALALVTTVCPGVPVCAALRRAGGRSAANARIVRACGAWLARFHAALVPPRLADALEAAASYIELRLRLLAEIDPARCGGAARERLRALLDEVAALGDGPAAVRATAVVHGDFAPHNILWDPRSRTVTAVDFTSQGPGFRADDLRAFARSLERRAPRARPLIARFRRAYREAGGALVAAAHPVARLVAAKHAVAEALDAARAAREGRSFLRRAIARVHRERAERALAIALAGRAA